MVETATFHDRLNHVTDAEQEEAQRYKMEIEWSPDDEVYVVRFPDAPGVVTHGDTPEEAVAQGRDAIITWLTAHRDAGLPVPPPTYTARNTPAPPETPLYGPEQIRQIRLGFEASQHVFADALNVSRGAVRAWVQGVRQPEGAAMKLIYIAEKHPEIVKHWVNTASARRREGSGKGYFSPRGHLSRIKRTSVRERHKADRQLTEA